MRHNKTTSKNRLCKSENQLRIIGGSMRGRKIDFIATEGLRPTLDQIRETLFNWLVGHLQNAVCLDLFAGSGALGFEALSRGAQEVIFVEANQSVSQQIQKSLQRLATINGQVKLQTAHDFLAINQQKFDLVFLDPPFEQGLLQPTLEKIRSGQHLNANALVYIEQESAATPIQSNSHWQVLKSKQTSRFNYQLIQYAPTRVKAL